MELVKELLMKLTSRKFLLVVFAIVVLLMGSVPTEMQYPFILLIIGYITGNIAQKAIV